jgi:hypothetical protein
VTQGDESDRRPAVRMIMTAEDGAAVEMALSLGAKEELLDQLWLRTLLINSKRGRSAFEKGEIDRRGDVILARLDP